jgi:hypothetical protein
MEDLSFRELYWKNANGESLLLKDMDSTHINNCIALIKRNELKSLKSKVSSEKILKRKLKEAEETHAQLKGINMKAGALIALEIKTNLMGEFNEKREFTEEEVEESLKSNKVYQGMIKELQYRIIEQEQKLFESLKGKGEEETFFEKKCTVRVIKYTERPEGIPITVVVATSKKIKLLPGDYLGTNVELGAKLHLAPGTSP